MSSRPERAATPRWRIFKRDRLYRRYLNYRELRWELADRLAL